MDVAITLLQVDPPLRTPSMTVFLVPVGAGRHALYCEVKETEPEPADPPPSSSWRARMLHRFRTTVADAEAEHEREELGEATEPRKPGLGRFIVRKIAEAVAEQRLLWNLRRASEGRLVHPDDVPSTDAMRMARTEFAADYRKHLTRGVVNGTLSAVLGVVFFFVPGSESGGLLLPVSVDRSLLRASRRAARPSRDHVADRVVTSARRSPRGARARAGCPARDARADHGGPRSVAALAIRRAGSPAVRLNECRVVYSRPRDARRARPSSRNPPRG